LRLGGCQIEIVVSSPKLKFSGFPVNVGEAGLKMTLQSVGPIVSFEVRV
jgi:hypothetical protein